MHVTCRFAVTLLLGGLVLAAPLSGAQVGTGAPGAVNVLILPHDGSWALTAAAPQGKVPSAAGSIEIRGLGSFPFDPAQIETQRKDVFQPGQFSIFDVLALLASQGAIQMESSWDESAKTHLVRSLNGKSGWWYDAHYAGGTFERPVVRMDEYPVKDGMAIQLYLEAPDRLAAILASFRDEVARLQANGGRVVLSRVKVTAPQGSLSFDNVLVSAHDSRPDVFQPGVITALDVLLSLGREGRLQTVGLTWQGGAEGTLPLEGYFVDRIDAPGYSVLSIGDCTYAHEVGSEGLMAYLPPHGHKTSHVHLTSDLKVLTSPEYVEFLWTCL